MLYEDEFDLRELRIDRLQQHASNNDKTSPNIVADDVSSCAEDESESEEQDETQLPMVIVKGKNLTNHKC